MTGRFEAYESSRDRPRFWKIELRMDSDALLNVMSAEEFSKYAASDVAEAVHA